MLETNKSFLNHDYYTDIITFDYTVGKVICGDLLISIDRVDDNAKKLFVDFDEELSRVIIHGILHLLGFKDKSSRDIKSMRLAENAALEKLKQLKNR